MEAWRIAPALDLPTLVVPKAKKWGAEVGGVEDRGPVPANQKRRIPFLGRVPGPILKGQGPGPGHTLSHVIYR